MIPSVCLLEFGTQFFMKINPVKPGQTLPFAIVLCLLATSCSPSKVDQCRELGQTIGQTDQQMRTITDSGRKKDLNTLIKAADLMESSAQNLQQIQLSDSQLKTLRTQLQTVYQDTGKTTRELVVYLQKKDSKKVDQTLNQLLQILKQQNQTLSGIKNYCEGEKPKS